MQYKRFEDVPVWQDAIALAEEVFCLTEDPAFRGRGDIANQMQRAGLSVSNNIAEGFERGTTSELLSFLYIAKGSAGEVRSITYVMDRLSFLKHLGSRISDLRARATSIGRQIGAWALSLQNSDIRGRRYMTDKSQEAYRARKEEQAFLDQLEKDKQARIARLAKRHQPPPNPEP